jgi:hypothetical protein
MLDGVDERGRVVQPGIVAGARRGAAGAPGTGNVVVEGSVEQTRREIVFAAAQRPRKADAVFDAVYDFGPIVAQFQQFAVVGQASAEWPQGLDAVCLLYAHRIGGDGQVAARRQRDAGSKFIANAGGEGPAGEIDRGGRRIVQFDKLDARAVVRRIVVNLADHDGAGCCVRYGPVRRVVLREQRRRRQQQQQQECIDNASGMCKIACLRSHKVDWNSHNVVVAPTDTTRPRRVLSPGQVSLIQRGLIHVASTGATPARPPGCTQPLAMNWGGALPSGIILPQR